MKQSCRAEILCESYPMQSGEQGGHQDIPGLLTHGMKWKGWRPACTAVLGPLQNIKGSDLLHWYFRASEILLDWGGEWKNICQFAFQGEGECIWSPDYHILEVWFSIQEPHSFRDGERKNFPKGQIAFMPFLMAAYHAFPVDSIIHLWKKSQLNYLPGKMCQWIIGIRNCCADLLLLFNNRWSQHS